MIKMRYHNGRQATVVVCDTCSELITDARMAAVVYKRPAIDGSMQMVDVKFSRKEACHNELEARLRGPMWQELTTHLMQLTYNSGTEPEALEQLSTTRDRVGL